MGTKSMCPPYPAIWAATQGSFFLQGIAFGNFVINTSLSECSVEQKSGAVSAAAFMLALEALTAGFFAGKAFRETGIMKEFYEVMDVLIGTFSLALVNIFTTELNNYQINSCK